MPTPPGFDNKVIRVTTPTAANINTELAAQNLELYWATSIEFLPDESAAFILFCKTATALFGNPFNQKVNQVAANQAAIDADKAAELPLGFWPTGIFITPGGSLFILYQQLDEVPLP